MTEYTSIAPPSPPARTNGMATTALVLGIVSIFANLLFVPTLLAVIFGIIGLRRAPASGRRGFAIAGIILGAVGFVVAVIVLVVGISVASAVIRNAASSSPIADAASSSAPSEPSPDASTSDEPTDQFSYEDAGLEASLKTTRKHCFGSAGCNVSVKVELALDDVSSVPEDASGTITYEIDGDESGPVIGTIELDGTSYEVPTENLSTPSRSTKVTVKLTDIETD